MAFTTAANIPWTRIKALSFDIYGTLIDWEGGIASTARATALGPHLPKDHRQLMLRIEEHDTTVQMEQPKWKQSEVITEGLRRYAKELKVVEEGKLTQDQVEQACEQYGKGIGSYPAFSDTIEAIQRLAKHYKLFPLTNVDNASYKQTLTGPLDGCTFTESYTAEDIGSYKPDLANFRYLLDHLKNDHGIEQADLVHVAQSLFHDQGPAAKMHLQSVWVDRQGFMGGETEGAQDKFAFQVRVESLGELAGVVDKAFGA
ncbi:hypothetical protein B0A50_02959 [Salinomyces thailandicus]|uniref:Uncharacterized protein n=1 Tax=Salinomyces thailandicus TaxID=706561 RepID=A0A4U0U2D2_9PEZI|nr:hypothetical protein B0A50_02959 [Salinomyces thailandica]